MTGIGMQKDEKLDVEAGSEMKKNGHEYRVDASGKAGGQGIPRGYREPRIYRYE